MTEKLTRLSEVNECQFCGTFTNLDHAEFWCHRCWEPWKIRTQVERLRAELRELREDARRDFAAHVMLVESLKKELRELRVRVEEQKETP